MGATAGSITDAVSASEASKTAVENNQFSLPPIPDNVYNRLMAVSNSMSMGLGVPISNWVNGYQVVDTNNPIYTNTNMPNLPQQNILLTEVIALSPNDTPVFAKVRS